ncbi:hypothetical protein N9O13_03010 [Crocinitomicaceae bacterium]|nr:hypothetical protein [Crocinitomicaceae bacterium]
MSIKHLLFGLLLLAYSNAYSQSTIDKNILSNNWMIYSIIHPSQPDVKRTRLEMKMDPKADFILTSTGNYDVSFENIGKGTWRLEDNILIFWGKDLDPPYRPKIEAVYKIMSLEKERLTLKLLWMTKHYDWEIELVPFN